jgi:hypothetical protein
MVGILSPGQISRGNRSELYRRLEVLAKFRPLAARGSAQLLNLVQMYSCSQSEIFASIFPTVQKSKEEASGARRPPAPGRRRHLRPPGAPSAATYRQQPVLPAAAADAQAVLACLDASSSGSGWSR